MGLEVSSVNTGFKLRASAPWGQLLLVARGWDCAHGACSLGWDPSICLSSLAWDKLLGEVGQGSGTCHDNFSQCLPMAVMHFWCHTSSCGSEKWGKIRWLWVACPSGSLGAARPFGRLQKLVSSAYRSPQLLTLGWVLCPSAFEVRDLFLGWC